MDGGEGGRQIKAVYAGHNTRTGEWFQIQMLVTANNGCLTYVLRPASGDGPCRIVSTDSPEVIEFIEQIFETVRQVSTPVD